MFNHDCLQIAEAFERYWLLVSSILTSKGFGLLEIKEIMVEEIYTVLSKLIKFKVDTLKGIVQKDGKSNASYYGLVIFKDIYIIKIYFTFENSYNIYIYDKETSIETVYINRSFFEVEEFLEHKLIEEELETEISYKKFFLNRTFTKGSEKEEEKKEGLLTPSTP